MRYAVEINDGVVLQPNDWVEVEFWDGRGVARGKFSGIWVNPNFGVVCYLYHLRFLNTPEVSPENYFFTLSRKDKPTEETQTFEMLKKAKVIPKPTRSKKQPMTPYGTTVH